jgi:two-component system, NarL family, response regulator NreC
VDDRDPASAPSHAIRILVCDDHRILTDAMASVIGRDGRFELVAPPVHTPQEAVERAAELRPDVVLMDVSFEQEMTGIDATREIRAAAPSTAVIIMTTHRDDRLLVEAVEAGAAAYVSKTAGADDVLAAARAVADGEVLFDARELAAIMARVAKAREDDRAIDRSFERLTETERTILDLMIEGQANDEIAAGLSVSASTVQTHVRNIVRKLGARSRAHAVAIAQGREPGGSS